MNYMVNYGNMSDEQISDRIGCIRNHFGFDLNNPSDAWPVIVENGISIDWPEDEFSVGTASAFIEDGIEAGVHFARKAEALRAAMIVYLMMQENEQ